MTNETIKQVVDIAIASKQYRSTDLAGWIGHIVRLANRGHLEIATMADRVIGFATWIRTPKPATEAIHYIPDNIDSGDYVGIILTCVTEGGSRTIRRLRDKIIEKAPDARFWQWAREKNNNRISIHKIRRAA